MTSPKLAGGRSMNILSNALAAPTGRHFAQIVSWALIVANCVTALAASGTRPNIIYILADDLGYGDLGCYGQRIIRTPRIDQMCREGLRFTQHYSGSCMCAPTRSTLMTGMHTGHTRVRGNSSHLRPDDERRVPLLPEDVTVAEMLRQCGYTTGVIGKWGIGEEGSTGVPNRQGFGFWFGYLNQSNAHRYYPPFLWRNEQRELYDENPIKRTHYSHDLMTDEAMQFIEQNKEKPFFLYLAYTLVHVDLDVPEDSKKPYLETIDETEPYGTPGGQHYRHERRPHATFAGMASRLDRDVGRILDLVTKLGIAENTLVLFTSDNGPTSAGGADPEFFDGNGPLRGIKFDLYEGGIRVPMIAWWPGTVEPGRTADHISAHWDLFPTCAELAGAEAPSGLDGVSFAASIRGDLAAQKQHEFLYWETYNKRGIQAIRKGNWKALRLDLLREGKPKIELYDLSVDVGEQNNVAKQHEGVATQLIELMDAAHVPNRHFAFAP